MQFDIRRFDIYRKIPKDLTQPTYTGACISICSCLFMAFLFISELMDFISHDVKSELLVDDPVSGQPRISVFIDISINKMACDFVGLDIQDDLGRHEVGFVENVDKQPIEDGAGCRFSANFKVNKVPGNFHISTHSSQRQPENPDMKHFIHEVVFGDRTEISNLPGSFNPLKGKESSSENNRGEGQSRVWGFNILEVPTERTCPHSGHCTETDLSSFDYFMKVVPTVYKDLNEREHYPYQYTYATRDYMQYGHGHRVIPAIWFRYDLSPITTKYTETRKPLYSFLTTVCAIVGGTFTVAGIIDSFIFTTWNIVKKAELNKLS